MPWSARRVVGRPSLSSFIAGAVFATAFVGVPAIAAVVSSDKNPTAFDGITPSLTVQPAKFYVGTSIDVADDWCFGSQYGYNQVPMKLRWNATDRTAGAASFDVYQARNGGEAGADLRLDHTTRKTIDIITDSYDGDCGGGWEPDLWWVTARDFRGATATSPMIKSGLAVWDDTGASYLGLDDFPTSRTGTWSTSKCKCANFGSTSYTTEKNASITYTVNLYSPGRTIAIVAPKSSNRGVMNISVDGATAKSVNTYAATTTNRVIVWQRTLNAGTHTIKVTNAGTTGHSRIDVDTLMLGPGWGGEVPLWVFQN
jgi:hypothetical protein